VARHVLCIAISLHKGSKSPDTKDHVSYCYRLLLFLFIVVHSYPFLLNNTCVKHNFKSVQVSNLFWSREYNSAKEICKYPSFSKVGGNYPLDLKIIWNSATFGTLFKAWFLQDYVLFKTFENDGYLHISFALLYSLLQKRLLTCTLLKLCLTQVLFNKCRMQVKCLIWLSFNANSAIIQLYHGKNKLIFNEMMMRSAFIRPTCWVGFL
jgi:hypothetical protein